jgi:hypothetical protein
MSCGVVTISAPVSGTRWLKVRAMSPVPGGMSTIRQSSSCQWVCRSSWSSACRADGRALGAKGHDPGADLDADVVRAGDAARSLHQGRAQCRVAAARRVAELDPQSPIGGPAAEGTRRRAAIKAIEA